MKFFAAIAILCCGLLLPLVLKKESRPDLTVMGFVNVRDGIGKQAVDLIQSLQGDLTVNFIATEKPKLKHLNEKTKTLLKQSQKNQTVGKVILFEDMVWTPLRYPTQKLIDAGTDAIKIAYSMWESSQLPHEWVAILNRHFDAVCVPAEFLVDVYHQSGVIIPVFVLPLGRDFTELTQIPLKQDPHVPFVFGNLSACSFRKNQLLLIQAFEKAFGNRPDVALRINCRNGEEEAIRAITRYIVERDLHNVVFTQFSLSPRDYLNALQEIDCYVSPSKGEGFSIQPREAMALGIPVICTNNTGQREICASGLVYPLETHILEAAIYPWGYYYGKQTNCTVDALSDALIELKEHYDSYLKRGEDCRKWAIQFDLSNLKPLYQTLVKPQKIELGEDNRIEAGRLITNSKSLFDKYRRLNNSR